MADMNLTARWVFPVSGPPLERGIVVISGSDIVAVEPHGSRRADVDFGNAAIVPGFVNVHTHLDLTGACGLTPPTPDFTAWLRSVIAYRKTRTPEQVDADIQAGIAECLRHGTTLLGDISSDGRSYEILGTTPLWSTAFFEMLGLSVEREDKAFENAQNWIRRNPRTKNEIVGNHSPD